MSGEQSINHDDGANQRQRHERQPNFWTRKILRGDGADLRANRRASVHDQRDQNVHITFHRMAKGSVTG